jgi:hypothetical protein
MGIAWIINLGTLSFDIHLYLITESAIWGPIDSHLVHFVLLPHVLPTGDAADKRRVGGHTSALSG